MTDTAMHSGQPTDKNETGNLISSSKVEGTAVYGAGDDKVGSIDHLMIDKMSGRVAYAVMDFGGFLGMGKDHYPVPWSKLTYDTSLDGYRTDITEEQLKGAPERTQNWASDRDWEDRTHTYYGVAAYYV
ncbi:PRC-barrel domain protein [Hasllibacter halocynthiae]|uniref:PRC-barrel domain protein n=1 Tax=Hasllibacter halocynthiae TaxID=595589 RepID=A0A2T0X162_9RHOB|nr:PRC-barrel domain-containing protein [Hasllibacter halocynthiae]PRY92594.1 PRC-barrel domain protein [Hasllibacter halocynthiae]